MLLEDPTEVTKDLLDQLQNPEFNDIKIVATDGEVPANKIILSMRSQYFLSMFSSNNNFVESSTGTVKLPYPKVVVEKIVTYLYSGEMDCEGIAFRSHLDLLELFNLMNLPDKYSKLEAFILKNIAGEKYSLTDCLKSLDICSKMGLQTVGATLLTHLGRNFVNICEEKELDKLSFTMLVRLLRQNGLESNTILRMKTLVKWLKVNNLNIKTLTEERKDKTLKLLYLNLEHFTHKELASSDVRKSGLYDLDKIFERMDQLFDTKDRENQTLEEDLGRKRK